jgi:hypothetical protein
MTHYKYLHVHLFGKQSMTDLVIVSVPYTDTTAPIMAPALLKGAAAQVGASCIAFDLNAVAVNFVANHPRRLELQDFFYFERVAVGLKPVIIELFELMTESILKYSPNMVALSLLHYQCQAAGKWLSFCLKRARPDIKIIMGGTGIVSQLVSTDTTYTEQLKSQGLIDHYIHGDGEHALQQLIKNNVTHSGIDSLAWTEIADLDSLPYPNYDDYNFDLYQSPFIGILGSRGCVRQCTFCDVHEHWKTFRWRSGESIFKEMMFQNQKYGTRFFKFQDSLINGNVKEYRKLIELLAEHNTCNPDNRLHWASYFIFRPAAQMPEKEWQMTAASGAYVLSVGVESLVDKNRHHIKKKFNNTDLEYSLAMAKKYGIKIFFITLVGYVTETEQDHQETLQWLREHQHYADDPIYRLSVGGTLAILPNTWLDRNQKEIGVVWLEGKNNSTSGKNHLWEIKQTGNNYETRVRRLNEMIEVGEQCGFAIHRAVIDPQKEMENMINDRMSTHYERTSHI